MVCSKLIKKSKFIFFFIFKLTTRKIFDYKEIFFLFYDAKSISFEVITCNAWRMEMLCDFLLLDLLILLQPSIMLFCTTFVLVLVVASTNLAKGEQRINDKLIQHVGMYFLKIDR